MEVDSRTDTLKASPRMFDSNVLDKLSPRDQQLLLMREEGFKYEEIAAVIGVAPASVGTLIARALRRFAELYASQGRNGTL